MTGPNLKVFLVRDFVRGLGFAFVLRFAMVFLRWFKLFFFVCLGLGIILVSLDRILGFGSDFGEDDA